MAQRPRVLYVCSKSPDTHRYTIRRKGRAMSCVTCGSTAYRTFCGFEGLMGWVAVNKDRLRYLFGQPERSDQSVRGVE